MEQTPIPVPEAFKELNIGTIRDNLILINDKVTRNVAAASLIQKVQTDEEDKKAEIMLVKTRNTYNAVVTLRKEITDKMDMAKKQMMEPEKKISPEHAGSEFLRIKKLRDDYANEKLKKQQANVEEVARNRAREEERIRLKGEFERIFYENIMDSLVSLEKNILSMFATVKLEEFDAFEKKFNVKPVLKETVFNSWFEVPYDQSKLTQEEYFELVRKFRTQYTYAHINGQYADQGMAIVEKLKARLPERRRELERLKELQESDAVAAATEKRRQDEGLKGEQQKVETVAAEQKTAAGAERERAIGTEKLELEFNSTVALQGQENVGGRKKRFAIVECKREETVQMFAKVLFACFTHPNFPGYIKKEAATGFDLPPDRNGVPDYMDWAKYLLDFFANNCDAKVDGVRIIETVSTIARG